MSDAILDHGGTLVAYMGDGIMAVFGAPVAAGDHPDRALAAARAMLERLDEFNAWMREGGLGDGFKMGIGLHSGPVMSGNVGSARRLEYAAIGDTTNTAARLEAMTKGTPYQLYVGRLDARAAHRAARGARARRRARRARARARDQRLGPARLRTASTPRAVASQVNGAARARPASRSRARRASSASSAVSAAAKASPSGGDEDRGAAARLRQRGRVGGDHGRAAGHRLQHGQPEALVVGGERERRRARVEAGQERVRDRAQEGQRLQALLRRELRAVAAGDDDVDALRRERPGGGDERGEVLARGLRGDAQHVGPAQAEGGAGALRVGARGGRPGRRRRRRR